jgi:hypothetical protein
MSIEKKSLISTLKTAKKANVAASSPVEGEVKGVKMESMKMKRMQLKSKKTHKRAGR